MTLNRPVLYLLLALGSLLTPPLLASDARQLSWSELAPTPVEYENPFEALSGEQLDALRRLVRLKSRVEASYVMQPTVVEPYR
jgi:hypothetical protein